MRNFHTHSYQHGHHCGHEHDHGHHHQPPGAEDRFRVVVTGKGGVGKTTITALLSRCMARDGFKVLALDADPQMNLPYALGSHPPRRVDSSPSVETPTMSRKRPVRNPAMGSAFFFASIPRWMTW
uniref:CobQ/CobB/MinD/ParA nucleotide binding domain-containing protein n=1 Tax=Candidatus Kentrum sp. FW TaxID=2126338 RepID=A0A450TPV8_9GAMM|nr:MAG: CobQ/CobB/MinD/ParA nucleotide binding domain-containing protein [Candidatus Kentron sp. FW]